VCGDPPAGLSTRTSIDAPCLTVQTKTGGPLGVAVGVGVAGGDELIEALGLGPPGPQESRSVPAAEATRARLANGVTKSEV
jgi:hypothetical protein